jgi:prolyl-tRNA editing enzyme YbaK/EbsC (Cys-tRNA(Pro) deacylase)
MPKRKEAMMDTDAYYEEKLKTFMKENGIEGEHLTFSRSCHSVAEAAEAAGVTHKDFVKSICMVDDTGRLIVGIVKGEDRASTSRTAKALNASTIRVATPDEVFDKTGYPCGGTPSFGFPARFLIDPKVMEMEFIYMGGGSETSLVKIRPSEIVQANRAEVVRIRK